MTPTEALLLKALEDIARGNVPAGFLESVDSEGDLLAAKAKFQERLATWMQESARAAIAKAKGGQS